MVDLKEKKQEEKKKDEEKDKVEMLTKQLEETSKKLAEAEKKIKYAPENVPIPKEQMGLPKGMQEAQLKTTVRNMTTVIEEKMMQLKDLATVEVLLDTGVRMKNRLESIKKMSSAQHIKVRGIWKTTPPQMYISKLEGKKINNDEYEISFGVYEVDDKGNKKLYTHYAEVLLHDGSRINRPTSAEYRIAYEVVERIKSGKPITREVIKIDRIQEE